MGASDRDASGPQVIASTVGTSTNRARNDANSAAISPCLIEEKPMPLFSTSFRGDNRAFAKFAQDSVAAPCGQMPRESGDDVGARSASPGFLAPTLCASLAPETPRSASVTTMV